MSENKEKGFLFNIITDTGSGHQIQVSFNLPVGATSSDMNKVTDEVFANIKRIEARTRLPAIEAQYLQTKALVEGTRKAVDRLRDAPNLNGKRTTQNEAEYQRTLAQLDADSAKLELHKRSLELTAKEAEMESSCLIQQAS